MKKPSVLTIILILLSLYLVGLSCLEYNAGIQSQKVADKMFEQNLNYSSASLTKLFSQNITSVESNEWKIAQTEDTLVNLQNEVSNNWWMDTYIDWYVKAKTHFLIALVSILVTILSWKIDRLKRQI